MPFGGSFYVDRSTYIDEVDVDFSPKYPEGYKRLISDYKGTWEYKAGEPKRLGHLRIYINPGVVPVKSMHLIGDTLKHDWRVIIGGRDGINIISRCVYDLNTGHCNIESPKIVHKIISKLESILESHSGEPVSLDGEYWHSWLVGVEDFEEKGQTSRHLT